MDLSIIIVSWNVKDLLRNCLNSIYSEKEDFTFEIFAVDNASDDSTAEMVSKEFPSVHLITNTQNFGFSRANNQAIKLSKGRNILFLNPDTVVVLSALQKMVKFIDSDPQIGAVGCKLLNPDGTIQNRFARSFLTPLNQLYEIMMLHRLFPRSRIFGKAPFSYHDHNESREVDCISGACLMVKREVLDTIGLFDERYFLYAEDVDLSYRIKKAGWRLYHMSDAEVIHFSGGSTKKRKEVVFSSVLMRESDFGFIYHYYGTTSAFLYRIFTCIGAMVRIVVISLGLTLTTLIRRPHKDFSLNTLRKYVKVLKWSLGLESWARQMMGSNEGKR